MKKKAENHINDIIQNILVGNGSIKKFIKKIESVSTRDVIIFNFTFDNCLRIFNISKTSFVGTDSADRKKASRTEARSSFFYIMHNYSNITVNELAFLFRCTQPSISNGKKYVIDAKAGRDEIFGAFMKKHRELETLIQNFVTDKKYGNGK